MRIRMNVALHGSDRRGPWSLAKDEESDRLDPGLARQCVRAGLAVQVPDLPEANDRAIEAADGFVLTATGGGHYTITGPDLLAPIKVKGRAKAEQRFAEVKGGAAAKAAIHDAAGDGQIKTEAQTDAELADGSLTAADASAHPGGEEPADPALRQAQDEPNP